MGICNTGNVQYFIVMYQGIRYLYLVYIRVSGTYIYQCIRLLLYIYTG